MQTSSESPAAQPLKADLQAWIEDNDLGGEGTYWFLRWKRHPTRTQPDLILSFLTDLRHVIFCLPWDGNDPAASSRLRYEFDQIVERHGYVFKIVGNASGYFFKRTARHRSTKMSEANRLVCQLPNGVELTVCKTSKHFTVRYVERFLSQAMVYLKHQADNLKTALYTGPYGVTEMYGRTVAGRMQLSHMNAEPMPVPLWNQAVLAAYSRAHLVRQMLDDLPGWRKNVEEHDGFMREAVGMLDKPGGDLLAMAALIKRPPKT